MPINILTNNILSSLTGVVKTTPEEVIIDDKVYYSFTVTTKRLSGYEDLVEILSDNNDIPGVGQTIRVVGFIFAYYLQNRVKLCLYSLGVIEIQSKADKNLILCAGTLTKPPVLRTTPSGTVICDVLIAVNNELGKTHSSYIPCVSWNEVANKLSELKIGDSILVVGRLQSREYVKQTDKGPETRIAKELSINSFSVLKEN